MKKRIIVYGKRNTGVVALLYIKSKGYEVFVADDSDNLVLGIAKSIGCLIWDTDEILGHFFFDMFLCVHGTRIFKADELRDGKMVNIHPCLSLNYKGHNPIKRYIENKDQVGSVESHYMVEEVDGGEIIHQEFFQTGLCNTYADFYNIANPTYYIKCIEKTLEKLGI